MVGSEVAVELTADQHVADFGEDDAGAQLADAGDSGQPRDRGAKGLEIGVDLLNDLFDRCVDGVDLPEM